MKNQGEVLGFTFSPSRQTDWIVDQITSAVALWEKI
jgi:hypothetical protein